MRLSQTSPGLTRDRKYGHANISGYDFIVIDTGGIDGTEEGVEEKMAEQSLLAMKKPMSCFS